MDTLVSTVQGIGSSVTGLGKIELAPDGTVVAPKTIVMTPAAARTYYNNYRLSHTERVKLFAAIEGLIAGNPPYNPGLLKKAGLAHVSNVNTLDAKAKFKRAALTFWNLINQTESLVNFSAKSLKRFGGPLSQDVAYKDWALIMGTNFTEVIKEMWEDFEPEMSMLSSQLVKFGISPVVWSDEQDFRWNTVEVSRFFMADQAPSIRSKWDAILIETVYTMEYLYNVYLTVKDLDEGADNQGWQKEALEMYLLRRANQVYKPQATTGYPNFLEFQQRFENGDLNVGTIFTDSVRLVSLFKKEYSNKISHYIFDPIGMTGDAFMFKYTEQYEEFNEALILFTYAPGEFTIHANRGVGHEIFPACQALMQLDNNMLDMAKLAATPMVRTAVGVGKELDPIRVIPGVITNLGTAEIQQNQLGQNLPGVVETAQYMDAKVEKNAIIGGDNPAVPDQDRGSKSAVEAQMQSMREFGIGKNSVAHFYRTLDFVYRNMVAKMLHAKEGQPGADIAKEWKDRCIADGVPEELFSTKNTKRHQLPNHIGVSASRVAGDGSNLGLIMGLGGVAGIAGGFGQKGQYNYRKDIIRARLGEDYEDRYLSDSTTPDESGGGASIAQLENIVMKQGEMPQATADNQHRTHVASHMALCMQIIQMVQSQQTDPTEADKIFSMVIPHITQHVQFLQQDQLNQSFLDQLKSAWTQVNKFAQLNRVRAQKMQQAEIRRREEVQQQLTADQADQQRKDMVAAREQDRKEREAQDKMRRGKEQSDARGEIMRKAAQDKADNQRLEIELEHQRKMGEAESQVQKPEEILANQSTSELQSNLKNNVGNTPNPADFE